MLAEQEKEKEENLQKKLAIIEKLKELSESHDDANKAYNEFKKLQQEWNEIKQVPAAKINELWKNYQLYAEKFYDLIKLNNEFREYDFKKTSKLNCISVKQPKNWQTKKTSFPLSTNYRNCIRNSVIQAP